MQKPMQVKMGSVTKNILTGLFTIVPIILTFYLLYWLTVSAEKLLGHQLEKLLPEGAYRPGMGVVIALALCFAVGVLMKNYVVRSLFTRGERLFYRLPLVKTIYPALRDFMDYFSPIKEKEYQQVVSVSFGNTGMQAIGLVTRSDLRHLPDGFNQEGSVLVYLPMSYMIGGYAMLVPRHAITPLDISMDEAMRFVLTAGVASNNKPDMPSQAAQNNKPPSCHP